MTSVSNIQSDKNSLAAGWGAGCGAGWGSFSTSSHGFNMSTMFILGCWPVTQQNCLQIFNDFFNLTYPHKNISKTKVLHDNWSNYEELT